MAADMIAFALTAVGVLSVVCAVAAIIRAQSPAATLAWLFAILFLPVIGAVAYLLLASPRVRRVARQRLRGDLNTPRPQAPIGAAEPKDPHTIFRLATRLTSLAPTAGNALALLDDDERAFHQIEAALSGAETRIWAEYYIIRRDQTGARFLDLLTERARAGVEVRLLYDAVGSHRIDRKRLEALRAVGGQTVAFLPPNPLRRRWSIHLRNHRKLIVIDGRLAFTGGMNVGDEYSGRGRGRGSRHFLDSHLQIRGPAVADLALVFADDWLFAMGDSLPPCPRPPPEPDTTGLVAVVPSDPDQPYNASAMVYFAAIAKARHRVWLVSPYFLPDAPTMQALVSAAMRGVDVRVMVPAQVDLRFVGAASRSYFPRLLRGGVRIFEYLPSMLHAKTLVVDGAWGIIGSANVDIRSFRLNFELGALMADVRIATEMEARFTARQARCAEVTLGPRSLYVRLRDGTARLLSPLM